MKHIESSLQLIREQLDFAQRPIVACSFGKDSIVLLHLCLQLKKMPVLYFKLPKFQEKHGHAYRVMQDWDLEVFEQLPYSTTYLEHNGHQEAFEIYRTGRCGYIALSLGIKPMDHTRYLCMVDDLYRRPHATAQEYPWDVTFLGHKACDKLPIFDDVVKSLDPVSPIDGTILVCPLAEWTEADIWDYIRQHALPYDTLRYDHGIDTHNPDHYPTCLNCVEGKSLGQQVWCPKYGKMIESISASPEEREQFRQELVGTLRYIKHEAQPEGVPHGS